jgi:hypothetical protein
MKEKIVLLEHIQIITRRQYSHFLNEEHFLMKLPEMVESERHGYLSVILQQLGNEVGFFQQKGEIETGND